MAGRTAPLARWSWSLPPPGSRARTSEIPGKPPQPLPESEEPSSPPAASLLPRLLAGNPAASPRQGWLTLRPGGGLPPRRSPEYGSGSRRARETEADDRRLVGLVAVGSRPWIERVNPGAARDEQIVVERDRVVCPVNDGSRDRI